MVESRTKEVAPSHLKLPLGRKTYDFLLNTAKVAGVLSLVYGVGFGIFQYYEAKKEKRIQESLSLFRQFNSMPFTGYRNDIDIALIDNRKEIAGAASDEKKFAATIADVVRKSKLEAELAFVFNFFDTVVYCAAKNICDPDVTYDLFYAGAQELYIPFYQYIQAQRNSFNDFVLGVETLVNLKQSSGRPPPNVAAK